MQSGITPLVHIVDDDSAMRDTLLALVGAESLEARGYASAREFLTANTTESEQPECIVLDIRMPEMSGIELLHTLRANLWNIPVLLVSGHADVPATIRGMKLGAVDLLQKPVDPLLFTHAIQRSLKISEGLKLEQADAASTNRRFVHLTARELELMGLVVEGQSSKQIAFNLRLSIRTVANHRASMMAKTGASNTADLSRLFTSYKSHLSRHRHPHAV